MAHCPYCGTPIYDNESYCVYCGEKLPADLSERVHPDYFNGFNRWWLLPMVVLLLSIISLGSTYFIMEQKTVTAQAKFHTGEQIALEGNYSKAKDYFKAAEMLTHQFPAASQNKQFMKIALQVQSYIDEARNQTYNHQYQSSLETLTAAEELLTNYNGEVVRNLIEDIVLLRNNTKVDQLQQTMEDKPSIEELKSLLWQADSIPTDAAKKITKQIREQIVAHSFSNANERLKQKQFSKARSFVEEGLRYAPNSNKLQSLKTTIEKGKTAFETAQQNRIEQAINAAEKEREKNQTDAVKVTSLEATINEFGDLVIKGKIKSVATVPINSVSLSYILVNGSGEKVLSNEVYSYPDTLYPGETGNVEFTHYDVQNSFNVKVDKVKWFLE
ncbi:zinc-ribbon domain-containing protein [Pontibacillus yanchengensis]|uniref:Zinc-ribbon domain-containing protein n=2 Tax=Pontibacillus yanchengensis TaxID=462910 RepID=A0ACC7VE61_9BACI|nr:zinc ribbon domain-containing protein [Pontibacillus yanchengensis]MYL34790.1 zinc-ribbon domain-containing protein [Pontibacillus yanchengensis]MYL52224.1 zinc-ribbon domain-containing protein [Pontibacillus yanchengensis]